MTTITTAPAATVTTGRAPSKSDKAAAAADRAKLVADFVAKWNAADVTDQAALATLADAQLAVENIRVIKSRIFFNLADLLAYKGEPSLAGATKALHDGKDTKKNTYRPYLLAGTALREAGFNLRTTAPDQEERDIVAKAFDRYNKEANKARKEAAAAAKAKEETTAPVESEETTDAPEEALTFATLLAHVARMNGTADMLIKTGVKITEDDMTLLANVLDDLQVKLAVHAG